MLCNKYDNSALQLTYSFQGIDIALKQIPKSPLVITARHTVWMVSFEWHGSSF